MNQQRKLILLSNDDGYSAPGINLLIDWLRPIADIVAVAPDSGRSGAACAITAAVPITVSRVSGGGGVEVYACSGTPVDCVKLALHGLVPRRPDLVVSGINHGDNASINVHYSGTLGVAIEGALQRLKAVAFSSCDRSPQADLSALKPYVVRIVEAALSHDMPELTCLNVNFPAVREFKGLKVCRMCRGLWTHEFEQCDVPGRGRYYFLTGNYTNAEPGAADTDSYALERGYVAVTPTQIDVTSRELAGEVRAWGLEG